MSATVITRADARVTETPNAVMTTLASPTQGGTSVSLWRTAMRPGQCGPVHTFDVDQVWHLLEGSAVVDVEGQAIDLSPGDTIVIPREAPRQVSTSGGALFVVSGKGAGRATPVTSDGPGEQVNPPWIV